MEEDELNQLSKDENDHDYTITYIVNDEAEVNLNTGMCRFFSWLEIALGIFGVSLSSSGYVLISNFYDRETRFNLKRT